MCVRGRVAAAANGRIAIPGSATSASAAGTAAALAAKSGRSSGGGPAIPSSRLPPAPAPVYGDLPDPARFADLAALDALAKEISSGKGEPLYLDHLYSLNLADLTAFARELKVPFEGAPNRLQLLAADLRRGDRGQARRWPIAATST